MTRMLILLQAREARALHFVLPLSALHGITTGGWIKRNSILMADGHISSGKIAAIRDMAVLPR